MTCTSGNSGTSADVEESLEGIREELGSLQDKMDKLFTVTKDMPIPPGLRILLTDAMKCKICLQSPVKPPIILAKCCKTILGCQECVDGWYSDGGLNKSCPSCQSPQGLSDTMILLGLDELAEGVRDILEQ